MGVLLSLFVPGFGLLRAGRIFRGGLWFLALYVGPVVVSLAFIWGALPSWICYAAAVLLFAAWLAMLVDSFRLGRLTTSLTIVFVLLLVLTTILPAPSRLVLQPFEIPHGSMQPTLMGVVAHPSVEPTPNILRRVAERIVDGRHYIDIVSQADDQILQVEQARLLFFTTSSRIVCQRQTFLVHASPEMLQYDFNVLPGRRIERGEIIARGAIDTGDHIFADKFSYNFRPPRCGDLVVFDTRNIPSMRGDVILVQRIAGLPGDTVRIDPPRLYINGQLAEGIGFSRVMNAQDGYRGYTFAETSSVGTSQREYRVPSRAYFVLGDNSYNSYDSRYWGFLPAESIYGRVARIYYPFSRVRVPQ